MKRCLCAAAHLLGHVGRAEVLHPLLEPARLREALLLDPLKHLPPAKNFDSSIRSDDPAPVQLLQQRPVERLNPSAAIPLQSLREALPLDPLKRLPRRNPRRNQPRRLALVGIDPGGQLQPLGLILRINLRLILSLVVNSSRWGYFWIARLDSDWSRWG